MIDKITNIFKDKKRVIIFSIVLGLILLLVVLFLVFFKKDFLNVVNKSDGELIVSEYEKLNGKVSEDGKEYPKVEMTDNNKFTYTNIDEILGLFSNKGDGVVYFGYSSCLYCRTAIQVLHDVSINMGIDKIYYLDVEKIVDGYDKLIKALGSELVSNGKIEAPLIIFVTDGKIASYNKGTLFSQEDPYKLLDEFQIRGLSRIYMNGINNVIESIKLKKSDVSDNIIS